MCTSLGRDGPVQPKSDVRKPHTAPIAAPTAAPNPGAPPIAPPTAPAAAPPTAPTPVPFAVCAALSDPAVAPASSASFRHSAMSRSAATLPAALYFSLAYRIGRAVEHATRAVVANSRGIR